MMLKSDVEVRTGNDRFEGYSVDLIQQIANHLNFSYEIRIVEDGNYGSYDKETDQWNGMIGELLTQVRHISSSSKLRSPIDGRCR